MPGAFRSDPVPRCLHRHLLDRGAWSLSTRLMGWVHAPCTEAPDATFAVSRLSWLECMVKPFRDKDQALADEYRAFFDAGQLAVVELTAPVVERAAVLRANHGLRTPDALQASSALELADEVLFLTNDRRFQKVPGLRAQIPA